MPARHPPFGSLFPAPIGDENKKVILWNNP